MKPTQTVIQGKYNTAIVYSQQLDKNAREQLKRLCDFAPLADSTIRVMSDVHAGAGCTIGTTMTIADKAVPNMVGVDIGCGMHTVMLQAREIDYAFLDNYIRHNIPAGKGIRAEAHPYAKRIDFGELRMAKHIKMERAYKSIGSLGGGNHFIEVDRDDDGNLYLVIHSGSRQLGVDVASYYQREAAMRLSGKASGPHVAPEMAYVEGALLEDYLHDMRITQRAASLNRKAIADDIINALKLGKAEEFETVHNYIDLEQRILRKGAVSAQKGERLLIPLNMRDGALICTGKGNPDWNYSAPHGAGRLYSRANAKSTLSMDEYRRTMQGIYTTSVSTATLDESPMAYKPMYEILHNIRPTVAIEKRILPTYNFKAGD